MDLKNIRRMAAEVLKCGRNRVWISDDPKFEELLEGTITRADVRIAISSHAIARLPVQGQARGRVRRVRAQRRKGRRSGPGSRRGTAGARTPPKGRWIRQVRPQRELLRALRSAGRIDAATYRRFYRRVKGGMFRSRAHLEAQLKAEGGLREAGA